MARRVPRLSTTFRRSLEKIGVAPGTSRYRAVFATIGSIAGADDLPGPADVETNFAPGRAYVRRVGGQNIWLLYRFDEQHVSMLTARDEPPAPADA